MKYLLITVLLLSESIDSTGNGLWNTTDPNTHSDGL